MKNILIVAALSVLLVGCKAKVIDEHAGHNHGEALLQLEAYNDELEVFAEVHPLAVGESSNILAFVTTLNTFKPLEDGSVTLSLVVGTKGVRQTVEKPSRAGVFSFSLQPEVAGEGQLIFDIKTAQGESRLVIPNVVVYADEHEAIHAAEEQHVENPNAITFTKEQAWKVDFATGNPQVEPFGVALKTTGQVESAQGDEQVVSARTSGIVAFSNNTIVDGQAVSAGQSLFSISSSGMADNNAGVRFAEAKSEYERTKSEYERAQDLAADKIVSQKELMQAKSGYDAARAVYESLQKNFNPSGQNVTSPMGGFVKQLMVSNGQFVEAGQALLSVVQNKALMIKAEVQQKYTSVLPLITSATVRIPEANASYTLEELNGKLISYGKSLNEGSYLVPVIFKVDNRAGFVSGSFVELYLKTTTDSRALTVPNTALVEEQGNYFVFVQLTPTQFEKREVKIGDTDGIKTEVKSGITAEDRIVTKGATVVKLAAASGAIDPHAGHVH